jgi:hypothetical protein
MSCTEVIRARVTAETKRQIAAAAEREMLSESAWLKRLLVPELQAARDPEATLAELRKAEVGRQRCARKGSPCDRPVQVLLLPEDQLLLDARAEARSMCPATYVSALTRCHLRRLALQTGGSREPAPATAVADQVEPVGQVASSAMPIDNTTVASPSEVLSDYESHEMDDWAQRVGEWLAVRDDPDALLAAVLLLKSWNSAQRVDLVRRAAALAPDSARIQATAMIFCSAPCDPKPYEQGLHRLSPENALAWTWEARRAYEAGDQEALQRAFAAMSRAKTFDTYQGATMLAMTAQVLAALVISTGFVSKAWHQKAKKYARAGQGIGL